MSRRKKALPPREIKARSDEEIARNKAHIDACIQTQVDGLQRCQDELVTGRRELLTLADRVDGALDKAWAEVLRLLRRDARG